MLTHPDLRHTARVRAVLDFFGGLGWSMLKTDTSRPK